MIGLDTVRDAASPEELVAALLALPSAYCFRGQGDASHALVSSLRRRLSHVRPDERRLREQTVISSFVNALGDRLEPGSLLGPVLALMQHHGAPTRLLDLSRSPLVALYFAVESLADTPGRIFIVDVPGMFERWVTEAKRLAKDAMTYEILDSPTSFLVKQEQNLAIQVGESINYPLPLDASRSTDRMRAQSGLFLAEPLAYDWAERAKSEGLWQSFEVAAEWKLDLLRIAVRTNNSAGTLFPGVDGVGRAIVERVVIGDAGPFLNR
jgi:hypothetical protein